MAGSSTAAADATFSSWFESTEVLDTLVSKLSLFARRTLACVNLTCSHAVKSNFTNGRLYVDWLDCNLNNARFVLEQLLPHQPGFILCAQDETWAPEMDLAELMTFKRVKLKDDEGELGYTASYFLGEALARTDCIVRLTTGTYKCLNSLRTNSRLSLSPTDHANVVDEHMLSGALRANAEDRIREYDSDTLSLHYLELNDNRLLDLRPCLTRRLNCVDLDELILSANPFGSKGLESILFPAGLSICRTRMLKRLCLAHVSLKDEGIEVLARAFDEGWLVVRDLDVSWVKMGSKGFQSLAKAARVVARRQQENPLEQGHTYALTKLDLSHNYPSKTRADFDEFLKPGTFPFLKEIDLHHSGVVTADFARLARAIKDLKLPNIETVKFQNSEPARVPMERALRICAAERELNNVTKQAVRRLSETMKIQEAEIHNAVGEAARANKDWNQWETRNGSAKAERTKKRTLMSANDHCNANEQNRRLQRGAYPSSCFPSADSHSVA